MHVLVTGATGFIGQTAVSHLLQQPHTDVTILVREAYSHADVKPLPPSLLAVREQINVVYADLRNFRLTVRAVRAAAPNRVLHLAAAGVIDPFLGVETALRHNVTGTINLLRACFEKTFTTERLVVARTPGELTSMNVYAASKAAAWNFCRMYGRTQQWPISGGMIFQAYGPGQSERNLIPAAVAAAKAGQDFPMTAGDQVRDWIHVRDVAAGLAALLAADLPSGTTVDMGSGATASVLEVVQLTYELAGKGGRPLPGRLPRRPGEAPTQSADAARTKELIGWETAVSLREGLKSLIYS